MTMTTKIDLETFRRLREIEMEEIAIKAALALGFDDAEMLLSYVTDPAGFYREVAKRAAEHADRLGSARKQASAVAE